MNNQSELEQNAAPVKQLHSATESGQAIVIMALLMVVLLGMLGLAIDGGGLFFLQRNAQNATDAAILSATYAICTKGDPIAAALATMAQNGFNNNGITNTVTVIYPGKNGSGVTSPNYVEVTLNAHKQAYFIQLVYRNPLQVTVNAVGNCTPPFDPSSVGGLWAGGQCQHTIDWSGSTAKMTGGLFSNNEIKFKGSTVNLQGGPIQAVGSIAADPAGKINYNTHQPVTGVASRPDPMNLDISLYIPGGDIAVTIPKADYHAIPWVTESYDPDDVKDVKGVLKWSPDQKSTIEGLYVVDGNVDVGTNVKVGPKGVTIVATGTIEFAGDAVGVPSKLNPVKYYEGVMNMTPKGVQYPGIIFFSQANTIGNCGDYSIQISGSGAYFKGVVYAPNANFKISSNDIYFEGTIVAQKIDYSGSKGEVEYNPHLLPPRPPLIQMVE